MNQQKCIDLTMILKEVQDFDSLEFKQSLNIYKSSFPPNETRPTENVIRMLNEDRDYHLFVALDSKIVVGMSLLYVFRSLNIAFLDYIAVAPNHQRMGVGKNLFRFMLQWCSIQHYSLIGLLMEIQKEDVADIHEKLKRMNRIRFYSRLGSKVLDGVNYMLPSQDNSKPEEMYLMIAPLTELHSLAKSSVLENISMIYSTIYQFNDNNNNNANLLNKTFSGLPKTIALRDV
jgi:GNAT superfamily N-acetyltransferase